MKSILAYTALLLSVCLASCHHLTEGTVISKHYEPEQIYTTLMPITISDGKSSMTTYVPITTVDAEDWVVEIEGRYQGEGIIEIYYVSHQQFECLKIGDFITVGDDCSSKDNNNTEIEN